MSTLSWLAHSEAEKQRTLEVIRLLDEPSTLDDLGIGGIRDVFSDLLFPGVSTIQSRARYFLFIPWIYRDLESRAPVKDAGRAADGRERQLIETLIESGDKGVIGAVKGKKLQQMPSATYWRGLFLWGIRRSNIGRSAYHRRLERVVAADPSSDGDVDGSLSIWHGGLPEPPEGFPGEAGMELQVEEADYLRDRILATNPGTLLAALVSRSTEPPDVDRPWELRDYLSQSAPSTVTDVLHHARCFAEVIHGAQLVYHVMLAEAAERPQTESGYREAFTRWAGQMRSSRDRLTEWFAQSHEFWGVVRTGNPRLRPAAQAFAESWFHFVNSMSPHALVDDQRTRQLITKRHKSLKGPAAKLGNRSALEAWNGTSGDRMLDYRWGVARHQVKDITSALAAGDRAAEADAEMSA